jgi:hypothetical protein
MISSQKNLQKTSKSKLEPMEDPECKSTHVNKNWQEKGQLNYLFVECGRQFIDC